MKKALWTLMILLLGIVGCNSSTDQEISQDLLADNEGTYSLLHVAADDGNLTTPDFLSEFDSESLSHTLPSWEGTTESYATDNYNALDVKEAPYYYFFDTEGIAFETGSKEEAKNFIQEKINNNS